MGGGFVYMKTIKYLLLNFAFICVAALANSTQFPEVSLDELTDIVAMKSATIIDANGASSYRKGHIPTALNYAAIKGKLDSMLPKDKAALIIAYCGGPMCDAWTDAAEAAQKAGYTNVKHFKDGISGWKKAKMATE